MMFAGHGRAKKDDSAEAGKTAAAEAAETVSNPDLVFVFSSPDHANEDMLGAVQEAFPEAVLMGCSTGGELWSDGLATGSVVLMAIKDDTMDIGIGVGENISDDNRAAGKIAATQALDELGAEESGSSRFTVFSTTLTGNGSEVMRGVKDVLGPEAHVTGGLAGDDWQLNETYVYYNGDVLTDAILVAAVNTDNIISHGIRHGLRKTGNQYRVTASEANIVKTLDDTPVADLYRELYGEPGTTAQFIMTKPLGIEVGEDEPRLRDPLIINDDGSIVYAAEVQEDSLVYVMESPKDAIINAAKVATEQAVAEAGRPDREQIKGVVLHDCVCRWHCLDNDETRKKEIAAVREVVGEDTPIIGWYTYGEIALPRALAGVHNQTLVVQLFVEQE